MAYKENIVKPNTMSDEDFADLKPLLFPRMKEYRLSADNNSLSVSLDLSSAIKERCKTGRRHAKATDTELDWRGVSIVKNNSTFGSF